MYCMKYFCENCYFVCNVWIPKGVESPAWFKCPNCELNELKKTNKRFDTIVLVHLDMTEGRELVRRQK